MPTDNRIKFSQIVVSLGENCRIESIERMGGEGRERDSAKGRSTPMMMICMNPKTLQSTHHCKAGHNDDLVPNKQ
jgi:hypothetical protein